MIVGSPHRLKVHKTGFFTALGLMVMMERLAEGAKPEASHLVSAAGHKKDYSLL